MSIEHEFKTAGYSTDDKLFFRTGPTRCGHIRDGVAFRHEGDNGGWVVDFNDLKRMYELALQAREAPTNEATNKT